MDNNPNIYLLNIINNIPFDINYDYKLSYTLFINLFNNIETYFETYVEKNKYFIKNNLLLLLLDINIKYIKYIIKFIKINILILIYIF